MLAWLGFGVGRAPATRPADSGSGSRQRRSSVENMGSSLAPGFFIRPQTTLGVVTPSRAAAGAAQAGGTAPEASNAAPNAVPARSSEANQLLFEQLAKRIENARAELGAIRRRVVPAALLFALVLLGLGGGLGGYLSSTRSPGSPLVLCLCAPGVLALALAIMPDDARIARVTALACGLALFVIAAAVLWEVSERAKRIADLGACEPVTPLYNQGEIPAGAGWAYELALALGGLEGAPLLFANAAGLSPCDTLLADGMFALLLLALSAVATLRGLEALRVHIAASSALVLVWRGAMGPFLILRGSYPLCLAAALAVRAGISAAYPDANLPGIGPDAPLGLSKYGGVAGEAVPIPESPDSEVALLVFELSSSACQLVFGVIAMLPRSRARMQVEYVRCRAECVVEEEEGGSVFIMRAGWGGSAG